MKKINGVHSVFMLRPINFGFNSDTKSTNPFQNEVNFDAKYISSKATLEFDEMLNTLQEHKINVHVFEDDKHQQLPDAVFFNNWLAVTPEKDLYLFPMASEKRRGERRDHLIESLKELILVNNTIDLSHHEKSGLFLESTGSIVFDYVNRIAYGSVSNRTTSALFDEFCKQINFKGFLFAAVDLKGAPIYHTNILLSIANAYAIICLDCIETAIERALIVKMLQNSGKKIIEISINQMINFAGNCLEVYDENGVSKLVMSRTGFSSLRPSQIQAIEVFSEIVVVNVSIIERVGGGSARCMMLGVPY